MKGWVKVLLGIGATLVFLVIVAAVTLVQSGKWQEIRGFSGGMVDITRSARALEKLEKENPYLEPADGRIPEARLLAYMEVCEAVKPAEGPYAAWMRTHMGKKGDFKDATEAITFMSRLMDTTSRQLREHRMNAREFAWLHHAVRQARKEAGEKAGSPMALELLETLRKAAKAPGLEAPLRQELEQKVGRYEAWLGKGKDSLSPNATLCLVHAERLRTSELGEMGEMLLGGMSTKGGSRRRGVRTEMEVGP